MTNKERHRIFEEKSISKLILIFSFPSIISLVLESLTGMIDTAFAGHLGAISSDALTAMGMLGPVLSLLIAAQLLFGVSTSIMISKGLGEDNQKRVEQSFRAGVYGSLALSSTLSILIFISAPFLLDFLGGTGHVRELAYSYLGIALVFNVFSSVGYTLVNNIRAFGYPKVEIFITTTATALNILCNILLTFVWGMGMKGIALATLISEMYYMISSMIFLKYKGLWFKKEKLHLKAFKEALKPLIKIGFVQFLMQTLVSLGAVIVNNTLLTYSGTLYIGPWGVVNKMHTIFLLPLIGLTQGVQSVLAYFEGRKDYQRQKKVIKHTVSYSLLYSILTTIGVLGATPHLIKLFTSETAFIQTAQPLVRIVFLSFPILGLIYTMITFMQVSEKEKEAALLGFSRQMGFFIPFVIIAPLVLKKWLPHIEESLGVFLAMPLADIGTLLLALYFYLKMKKGGRDAL